MENASLQASLLELLRQARRAELAWISTLSPDAYEVNGTPERWSARNLLAHIAAWKRQGIEWLAAAERDDPSPHFKDMEQFNEETFTTSQGLSWQEIQNEARVCCELMKHERSKEQTDEA